VSSPPGAQEQIVDTVRHLLFCRCGHPPEERTGPLFTRSKSLAHVTHIYNFACRHFTGFVHSPFPCGYVLLSILCVTVVFKYVKYM
jgi:hypothetical protein